MPSLIGWFQYLIRPRDMKSQLFTHSPGIYHELSIACQHRVHYFAIYLQELYPGLYVFQIHEGSSRSNLVM